MKTRKVKQETPDPKCGTCHESRSRHGACGKADNFACNMYSALMTVEVTQQHREIAVECLRECGPSVDAWVPNGQHAKGLIFNSDLDRVAQAIAESELVGKLAVLEEIRTEVIRRGYYDHARAVTDELLVFISAKYGAKL